MIFCGSGSGGSIVDGVVHGGGDGVYEAGITIAILVVVVVRLNPHLNIRAPWKDCAPFTGPYFWGSNAERVDRTIHAVIRCILKQIEGKSA